MHVQTRTVPFHNLRHKPTPPPEENEPSWMETHGDRLLAGGTLAAVAGAVIYAGSQGLPGGALMGAVVSAGTGLAAGIPMQIGSRTISDQISNYLGSSISSLTLGTVAGAFAGAQGYGLLAAAGIGVGAAAVGRLAAEFI